MMLAPTPQLSARTVTISGGLSGTYQTIARMRALVREGRIDPVIRQAATGIIFLTPEKNQYAEAEALFNFVRDTIRYTRDVHQVETLSTPRITLVGKIGDCDDQTTLLASLLEAVGYPTRFVIAGYWGSGFSHVYLQAWISDQWIDMDPTENHACGYAPPEPTSLQYEVV